MQALQAIISILIAQAAGLIGSLFTAPNIPSWYVNLIKPNWNPPSWLFGPVWLILYSLMGYAAYLVWQQRDLKYAKAALVAYGIQLALNAIWSILFFGQKDLGFALIEILVLLAMIIVTTVLFWRVDPLAGKLMIPYILWVSFATVLNYSVWQLN